MKIPKFRLTLYSVLALLLLKVGGLDALQSIRLTIELPFSIIMLLFADDLQAL